VTVEQELETISGPGLGEPGEPCARCGAPLAHDQRYCLECGLRRADARIPFAEVMEERIRREAAGPPARKVAGVSLPPQRPVSPVYAGAGVALLALALGLGVVIGSAGDDQPRQVAAAPPQVITIAASGAAQPAAQEFTGDWPDGKNGYTVQLRALPKDGTQVTDVQAAKSQAQSQGAADVGALDSDDFASLDGGDYVVYSGVFETRRRAKRALRALKGDFPGAKVVRVSASGGLAEHGDKGALSGRKKEATVGKKDLKELQKLSPEEYQKKARKLPDTTKLPGKAPPTDNKKPGGGTKGEEIG
jgi:hypothetical protein